MDDLFNNFFMTRWVVHHKTLVTYVLDTKSLPALHYHNKNLTCEFHTYKKWELHFRLIFYRLFTPTEKSAFIFTNFISHFFHCDEQSPLIT